MGKLQEELNRFNAINKYTEKLLSEQGLPVPPPPAADPKGTPPSADPNAAPADPNAIPPPSGNETEIPAADDTAAAPTDAAPGDEVAADTTTDDTTEEIDMTDLVNMVKDVKKQLDTPQQDNGAIEKMDAVFNKLGELEVKLGEMDQVLAKIDQLGAEVQASKPKTPMEKLEMRSLDSYPFNKKPDEFFQEKQPEMEKSGKNEYVLTKGDVENYGKNEIMKSFNPKANENNYNF
jgi:hypothetical protein